MAGVQRLNGRPEPEVIVNVSPSECKVSSIRNSKKLRLQFTDGFAYSKQRMEDAFKSGLFDKPPPKAPKEVFTVRKDDVDLIVSFEM